MLRSSRLSLVVASVSIPVLLAFGCTVTSTSSSPTASTSDGAGAGSSISSTSVVSTTGVVTSSTTAGAGGVGGGTETTASSSTGVGGGACTDPTGTGAPVDADCDAIPSAGATSTCGGAGGGAGSDPPPDPGVCHQGFKVYTVGAAEELASCLNNILLGPGGDNCADADLGGPIQMCVQEIYDNACANPQSDGACDSIATACAGETFDVATCKRDLVVFSDASLSSFADCMNADATDPCQTVYDDCFIRATTVQ